MKFVKYGEQSTFWPDSDPILTKSWITQGLWFLDGSIFTDVSDRYDIAIADVKDYHGIITFKIIQTDRLSNEVKEMNHISLPGRFGLTSICPYEGQITTYMIESLKTAMKFTGFAIGDPSKAICIRFDEEGTEAPNPVFLDLEGKTYVGTNFFCDSTDYYSLETKITITYQYNDIVKMTQENKAAFSDWTFVTCGMTHSIIGVSEFVFLDGEVYHGSYTGQFSDDLSKLTITGMAASDSGSQMVIIFDLMLA